MQIAKADVRAETKYVSTHCREIKFATGSYQETI